MYIIKTEISIVHTLLLGVCRMPNMISVALVTVLVCLVICPMLDGLFYFPKYPCLTNMTWVWVWDMCPTPVSNVDTQIL